MLLTLRQGYVTEHGVYRLKAMENKAMTENENFRLFLVKQTSLNLERMLPMMNMRMKWQTPQLASRGGKKRKKKKRQSMWICSSCTTMRLNSANNQQQDKRKETGDSGFESAGKRWRTLVSDKRGPLLAFFLPTFYFHTELSLNRTVEVQKLSKFPPIFPACR